MSRDQAALFLVAQRGRLLAQLILDGLDFLLQSLQFLLTRLIFLLQVRNRLFPFGGTPNRRIHIDDANLSPGRAQRAEPPGWPIMRKKQSIGSSFKLLQEIKVPNQTLILTHSPALKRPLHGKAETAGALLQAERQKIPECVEIGCLIRKQRLGRQILRGRNHLFTRSQLYP